ncbi:zinc finger protein 135 isoform X1 [Syngnathus scovelli]|uniref:zinc finger protein 135 isoform X1 n=2 Tax=Syngnathus scovelli TaxID=161590 RepID=UPI002110CA48|nr:zinc finger protein 135 isoform X1 [Syngnathus scovelli]
MRILYMSRKYSTATQTKPVGFSEIPKRGDCTSCWDRRARSLMMDDSEAQLTVSEADALGADFITVELDTQPIEYVVKWAEVGSKFTISCVKKDSDDPSELSSEQLKMETDEAFFAPYEEVYPCEVTEQSVEIKMESDDDDDDDEEQHQILVEVGGQPDGEADSDRGDLEPDERRYRCGYCGKCYSHASSLYRHQQTHAAKVVATPAPAAAKRALEPAQQDARYACQHCGMTFKGSRMLGSHLRLHGKRRIHPCNICGKEFNHSSSLSRHRLIHKKAKDGIAGHTAPARSAYRPSPKGKRAKRRRPPAGIMQAPGPDDKFYACPQCEMSFRSSAALSKHQVTHVKELLDSYAQPGKENLAESSSDLKIRLKLCSRDKPNFYTLCKKNRRRRRRPKQGLDEAQDEDEEDGAGAPEAHGCGLCGKRFSHTSSLARHQLSHQVVAAADGGQRAKTKTKTFTCAACNKTFMHSSSFSRHKKAHLGAAKRAILDETAPIESDSD